jgi:MoaA/NifB/PqqE/SkfB family radical SAM enzyme
MKLTEFYARCWENRRLLSLMLEITYACDLRCDFCYNEKEKQGEHLSLEDYRRILGEARAEGALFLTLTGGEPTLHPDFFAIGAVANGAGFSVRVKSNGHGFDRALIRRLKDEVQPYNVDLSIHGATPAVHDAVTGVPGSHGRLLRTVAMLQEAGIRIRFKLPLTRRNEAELDALFDLASSLDIKLDVMPEISPRDTGDLAPTGLMASREGLRRLFARLHRDPSPSVPTFGGEEETDRLGRELDTPFACGAGLSNLMVDPFGVAYGCVAWRSPLGDLRRQSVRKVWLGPAALHVAELNREAGARKRLNPVLEGEMFCPGRACLQYGNPLTIYPDSVILASLHQSTKKTTH